MDLIKSFFNLLADPRLFFFLTSAALVLIVWKREAFAKNMVGYGLLIGLASSSSLAGSTPTSA